MARPRPLRGEFRYRHPIEIRFGDTDALGHVNNAVYFSYFEAARGGYYREVAGQPFGTPLEAVSVTLIIAEAHITYRSQARYGEPLVCACRVSWAGRSSFGIEYRLEAEASMSGGAPGVAEGSTVPEVSARLVAEGSTVQVFYDLRSGSVTRMPSDLAARIDRFEGRELPKRPAAQT